MENITLYTSLIPPECKGPNKLEFNKKGDIYFFGWILFELFIGKKYEDGIELNNIINILNQYQNNNINNPKMNQFKLLIIKSLEKVNIKKYILYFK